MNEPLILANISPIKILTSGIIAGVLLISYLTILTLQQPWIGIDIQYQPGKSSIKIEHVLKNSPAENILKAGDEIIGFQTENKIITVNPLLNIEEPAILSDYRSHNQFTKLQDDVHRLLLNNKIIFKLKNKDVVIEPKSSRPISSLPFTSYWLIILFGFSAFLIGLNIWSFRRGIIVSRILAIAGTAFFLGALFNAVTLSREIALTENFYYIVSSISHLGIILFAFSTIAILWHYPQRISFFPTTTILYIVSICIWINQTWQVFSVPFHAYYFHFLIDFIFLAGFAIRQWHQARNSTIDQTALQWLLFTLLLSLGLTIILFYMPTIYSTQPVLPVSATYFSALLLFLGLTMGVIKYQLFNMPSVWMEVWIWVIGGTLLLLIDLALVYLLHLTSGFAFIMSAIIVGWIYYPSRQWISVNILKLKAKSIEQYFPLLIEQLITTQSSKSFDKKWEDILKKVFLPLDLKYLSEPNSKALTYNNGINLKVPSLDKQSTILLSYKDSGNKLYTQNDSRLCQSLYDLTQYTANIKQEYAEGAQDERTRIARDLHDDTAAQLLTLIHRSKDKKTIEKTRDILKVLRQTIYSLDTDSTLNLKVVIDNLYQFCDEKVSINGLKLYWESYFFPDDIEITPRQQINLQRSTEEILLNVFQHANASKITVVICVSNRDMHIQICDDGHAGDINSWVKGKGLNNIFTRMHEISGSVNWQYNTESSTTVNKQGSCLNLQFPI